MAELEAIVADYRQQAAIWNEIPLPRAHRSIGGQGTVQLRPTAVVPEAETHTRGGDADATALDVDPEHSLGSRSSAPPKLAGRLGGWITSGQPSLLSGGEEQGCRYPKVVGDERSTERVPRRSAPSDADSARTREVEVEAMPLARQVHEAVVQA